MKLVLTLVSTNAGWITRLGLKYVSIGAASLSAWLTAQGIAENHTAAIAAGVTAGAAALIEQGLSWVARKHAVK
jgi:hypothetical protein